jgi:RNA polymerase-binding protein DksA
MSEKGYPKRDLDRFKKIIMEQMTDTKGIIDAKVNSSSRGVAEDSGETHSDEMGTENNARELDVFFAEREGKYITNLENALARIENGTFGICRSCGCLISKRRLEVVPHATLCINCKSDRERKD